MSCAIYMYACVLKTEDGKEYQTGGTSAYRTRESALKAATEEAREQEQRVFGSSLSSDGKQVVVTLPNVCSWTYRPYAIFLED